MLGYDSPTDLHLGHLAVNSSGAVRVRRLAQGPLDNQLGGASILLWIYTVSSAVRYKRTPVLPGGLVIKLREGPGPCSNTHTIRMGIHTCTTLFEYMGRSN